MVLKEDVLYAPWRKKYWNSSTKKNSLDSKKCVFCNILNKDIIVSSSKAYIQSNAYPYSDAHLLVIPKRHINNINDLTSKEREEIFNLIDLAIYALNLYVKPEGFNIGCNQGKVAGESISHLHFHVLPRHKGDVGFARICNFNLVSVSPDKVTEDLRNIILKHKLKRKFNI